MKILISKNNLLKICGVDSGCSVHTHTISNIILDLENSYLLSAVKTTILLDIIFNFYNINVFDIHFPTVIWAKIIYYRMIFFCDKFIILKNFLDYSVTNNITKLSKSCMSKSMKNLCSLLYIYTIFFNLININRIQSQSYTIIKDFFGIINDNLKNMDGMEWNEWKLTVVTQVAFIIDLITARRIKKIRLDL